MISDDKFIEQLSVDTKISKEDLIMYAIHLFRDWCERRRENGSSQYSTTVSEIMLIEDLRFLVSATKVIQEFDKNETHK